MKKKIGYSFDDEVVTKFCYDMENNKIEIHFAGYFDILNNEYIDNPCVWIIEKWNNAKSKLNSENSYAKLDKHLGIISMILSLEMKENSLQITVNTLDNHYVDLLFDGPELKLS